MLVVGIVQSADLLDVCVRSEEGEIVLSHQVGTRPERVAEFFESRLLPEGEPFVAMLADNECRGWLLDRLPRHGCQKTVVVDPAQGSGPADRLLDAETVSELLWAYRVPILSGKRLRGLRLVELESASGREERRLTELRKDAVRMRRSAANRMLRALQRNNLHWGIPTESFPTKKSLEWVQALEVTGADRLELDHALHDWRLFDNRVKVFDGALAANKSGESADEEVMPLIDR